MQQAETAIVELGQMFTKMATLVAEQGETVERIDADMDEAGLHARKGHSELLKYYRNISGERQLIIKVFAVLMIFISIFVVFVA